ncbi:MAG: hypothetical protein Q9217_000595 [Psora testacea]
MAATNTIDGGVSTVSGRTCAVRTSILTDPTFTHDFLNEYIFFGLVGPLNADDDKFITRWVINRGWKIKIQHLDEVSTETDLGSYPKYLSQCLRWARTSWRSNLRSLFLERTVWKIHPWCVYAIYLTSFVNMALFYDGAMIYALHHGLMDGQRFLGMAHDIAMTTLICWILASKLVKLIPHLRRCPGDAVYLPGYLLFAYFHSLLKLYALFTCWNISWGSRPGMDNANKSLRSSRFFTFKGALNKPSLAVSKIIARPALLYTIAIIMAIGDYMEKGLDMPTA